MDCNRFKTLCLGILVLATFESMAQKIILEQQTRFLALGDSYTIGESVAENERWPIQLADALKKRGIACGAPRIIATTGWRTDDLKRAMDAAHLKPVYTLVSLLIGVNNQYQGKSVEDYKPEFEALLKTAIHLAGDKPDHVFVVSIPDYSYTPFGLAKQETITRELDAYNAAARAIAEKYRIAYINITDISRRGLTEPELVANDGLHPSGKMYAEWVEAILPYVKKR